MILVTGGTGFIGRELVRQLVTGGHKEIICLVYNKGDSELEKSGRAILKDLGVTCIAVDLVSGEGMKDVPRSPDLVFHLASVTVTAQRDHSINTIGTRNLMEAILPLKESSHFIFASTICVSDDRNDFNVPFSGVIDQGSVPKNEYGIKKLEAENYLRAMSAKNRFALSVIRVTGVYGKGVRPNGLFDHVQKLSEKGSFWSRLNWPGLISVVHINDMAAIFISASQKVQGPGNAIVYVPATEALTLMDMCKSEYAAAGMEFKPIHLPAFFWAICRWQARRKSFFMKVLPHEWYDRFWQACILVNNEFWHEPMNLHKLKLDKEWMTFDSYCKLKRKG